MNELDDYDYTLPEHLVARFPPERREQARLLVVQRATGSIEHASILDLPRLLRTGDRLVLNDTRVLPARLLGQRAATGGRWEGLYLGATDAGLWRLIGQTRGKLRPGEILRIHPAHGPEDSARLHLTLVDSQDDGIWTARPDPPADPREALSRFGTLPLPPYLRRELAGERDFERYQTTFCRPPGSVAAPTAGLHFTPELLAACASHGVAHSFVTLHVGLGTFRPIAAPRLSEHRMHEEWCELSPETARQIRDTRAAGGRIVAVGTTTVRTLETAAQSGTLQPFCGETDLFVRPPFVFGVVDCLLTNFHLPRSSLLVLVSTFAGRELIRAAYEAAIREEYRFFSYGDAMLVM